MSNKKLYQIIHDKLIKKIYITLTSNLLMGFATVITKYFIRKLKIYF